MRAGSLHDPLRKDDSDRAPLHLPPPRLESWSFQGARLVAPARSSSLALTIGDATRAGGVASTRPWSPMCDGLRPSAQGPIYPMYCVAHIATMIVSRDFGSRSFHWPLIMGISCRLQPPEGSDKVLPLCPAREALQNHPLDNDALLRSLRRAGRDRSISKLLTMVQQGARRNGFRVATDLRIAKWPR